MKGVCPGCGFCSDLEGFLNEAKWREALVPALALPTALAPLIVQYLRLHSPAKQGLRAEKVGKLLGELADCVSRARVSRNGVEQVATVETWKAALEEVMSARDAGTLVPPLNGHGYLFQVAASIASQKSNGPSNAQRRGETPVGYSAAFEVPEVKPEVKPEGRRFSKPPVSLVEAMKKLNA
jgi:hypothetical protein